MESVQVFITAFNRLTTTRILVDQLLHLPEVGEITILDNNSTYPPLLQWYENECPVRVLRFDKNYLSLVLWRSGTIQEVKSKYYIVTDGDVSIERCPSDFIKVLREGFQRYPDKIRVAPGIALDDLPQSFDELHPYSLKKQRERSWNKPLDEMYFDTGTDTVFCLLKRDIDYNVPFSFRQNWRVGNGLRTNYPYVVRHMPWYVDCDNASDEEFYYWFHWNYPGNRTPRPYLKKIMEARKRDGKDITGSSIYYLPD